MKTAQPCPGRVHRTELSPSHSPRRISAMDPPSPSRASQTQPAAPSPLTSYRWHSGGGGEKGAGGFRWGRLAAWGRAQSHQETTASSQPAPRSLFRRVLSAPPKESRTSRLKISKSLWGKNKSPLLDSEPEPENPGTWLPAPPRAQAGRPGCREVLSASGASALQTQEVVGSAKAQQEVAGGPAGCPLPSFPLTPGAWAWWEWLGPRELGVQPGEGAGNRMMGQHCPDAKWFLAPVGLSSYSVARASSLLPGCLFLLSPALLPSGLNVLVSPLP